MVKQKNTIKINRLYRPYCKVRLFHPWTIMQISKNSASYNSLTIKQTNKLFGKCYLCIGCIAGKAIPCLAVNVNMILSTALATKNLFKSTGMPWKKNTYRHRVDTQLFSCRGWINMYKMQWTAFLNRRINVSVMCAEDTDWARSFVLIKTPNR